MERYITDKGERYAKGQTESGLNWNWYQCDSRSLKSIRCGTLVVNGKKIFTKGTIQEAIKYVSKH